MFHRTSCIQLELRTNRKQQLHRSMSSSCKRKSWQADHDASSSHIRCRRMELHMDRKQRFQRHMLELHRNRIRLVPFQRHRSELHKDRKKRSQRHSLEHKLTCKPTYPSIRKACPSSP